MLPACSGCSVGVFTRFYPRLGGVFDPLLAPPDVADSSPRLGVSEHVRDCGEIGASFIRFSGCTRAAVHGPHFVRDLRGARYSSKPSAVASLTYGQAMLALHDSAGAFPMRHGFKKRE